MLAWLLSQLSENAPLWMNILVLILKPHSFSLRTSLQLFEILGFFLSISGLPLMQDRWWFPGRCVWRFAGRPSFKNMSLLWIPHFYSEQLILPCFPKNRPSSWRFSQNKWNLSFLTGKLNILERTGWQSQWHGRKSFKKTGGGEAPPRTRSPYSTALRNWPWPLGISCCAFSLPPSFPLSASFLLPPCYFLLFWFTVILVHFNNCPCFLFFSLECFKLFPISPSSFQIPFLLHLHSICWHSTILLPPFSHLYQILCRKIHPAQCQMPDPLWICIIFVQGTFYSHNPHDTHTHTLSLSLSHLFLCIHSTYHTHARTHTLSLSSVSISISVKKPYGFLNHEEPGIQTYGFSSRIIAQKASL